MDHEPWDSGRARDLIEAHAHREGAALPILHALTDAFGCVPAEAIPMVASALNWSRAEVHGVATFYPDFRREQPGRHVVRLCRSEACQAVGAVALADHARRRLGIGWHETTSDGEVTLEPVFCLGLCARGPSAMIDGEPACDLTPDTLDARLAELRA
ncbi:formate dehydrogenase subunit gamma [Enterovirga rhinocerotis]|uniref:Formate dehydrogenase gamma subunit n=1 Tax=Enterovirga rhinocerotis TaxID=1339210 RepID=A0A4R7BX08_9HYPH|nr:formate dehydrogenase subunit gamma [Enterovirga rhinocerotis]TDR89215.1 formate dehydrogenase gamma subunit [Enterovirga rhinocerotis]